MPSQAFTIEEAPGACTRTTFGWVGASERPVRPARQGDSARAGALAPGRWPGVTHVLTLRNPAAYVDPCSRAGGRRAARPRQRRAPDPAAVQRFHRRTGAADRGPTGGLRCAARSRDASQTAAAAQHSAVLADLRRGLAWRRKAQRSRTCRCVRRPDDPPPVSAGSENTHQHNNCRETSRAALSTTRVKRNVPSRQKGFR